MRSVLFILCIVWGLQASEFDEAVSLYKKGSYIQALHIFHALAQQGDAKAQYNVGLMYALGKGERPSKTEAMRWYEKAARLGNAKAQYNLARRYHAKADTGIQSAYEKAKYWYEKAVENNITKAYNNLAALDAKQGQGEADKEKIMNLLQEGAKKGDSTAWLNLARIYAWGDGVTNDKLKAYELFKAALKNGRSEASGYLDRLCEQSRWACEE